MQIREQVSVQWVQGNIRQIEGMGGGMDDQVGYDLQTTTCGQSLEVYYSCYSIRIR